MKQVIPFELDDGSTMLVEVEETDLGGGLIPAAAPERVQIEARQTFDEALEQNKSLATRIIAKIQEITEPPAEAEVEFGLKITGEAGVVLASAGVEAHYKVKLIWKNLDKKD